MKSLLCIFGCVAIALATPWAAAAMEPLRSTRQSLMPPAMMLQVTNASANEVQLYVDGQFVGNIAVQQTVAVSAYPGHRFVEWIWPTTGQRGSAMIEVPDEPIWFYTIH